MDINYKCNDSVDGGNGFFMYGIPFNASRVLQFNLQDKSMDEIEPDLGKESGKIKMVFWRIMEAFTACLG